MGMYIHINGYVGNVGPYMGPTWAFRLWLCRAIRSSANAPIASLIKDPYLAYPQRNALSMNKFIQ